MKYGTISGSVDSMSNIEHYFENLLYQGEDRTGAGLNVNKNQLSTEVQEAVEECANYILYTMFPGLTIRQVNKIIEEYWDLV